MNDSWLDVGHGDGQLLAPVSGSRPPTSTALPVSGTAVQASRTSRIIVAAIAAMALAGSSGTAYAIRETLFPSIGAPTPRSVWQNPVPADESTDEVVSPSTSTPSTTPSTTTPPTTTLAPEASNAASLDAPPVTSRDDSRHGSSSDESDDSGPRADGSVSDDSGSESDDSVHSGSGAAVDDSSGSGSDDSSGSGSQDSSGSGKDSDDSNHSGSGRDDKPED